MHVLYVLSVGTAAAARDLSRAERFKVSTILAVLAGEQLVCRKN